MQEDHKENGKNNFLFQNNLFARDSRVKMNTLYSISVYRQLTCHSNGTLYIDNSHFSVNNYNVQANDSIDK